MGVGGELVGWSVGWLGPGLGTSIKHVVLEENFLPLVKVDLCSSTALI